MTAGKPPLVNRLSVIKPKNIKILAPFINCHGVASAPNTIRQPLDSKITTRPRLDRVKRT